MDSAPLKGNRKKIRALLQSKKNKGVSDPPRFPRVSDGFENQFKRNFAKTLQNILDSTGRGMVDILSEKNNKREREG